MPHAIPQATRAIVISDLHLGGEPPHMMSRPGRLASFIAQLPATLEKDERLELIIGGDFIDFLAITPWSSWTPDPRAACDKLNGTIRNEPFAEVFHALARLVAAGHRLTILVGNHDVELALPPVQASFLANIGATAHEVLFVDDGLAYRIGQALVEHGNRYDGANLNDWDGLRTIASALSRQEDPPIRLKVSAGSYIVERVVNSIKGRYPFIDLLQPQGELVALLLLAFEPELLWDVRKLGWVLRGWRLQGQNPEGLQPGNTRNVGAQALDEPDPELARAFGPAYEALRSPDQQVAAGDWLPMLKAARKDSLSAILERGDRVPSDRLQQIRVAMRRLLLDDQSDRLDGPTEQYGKAAARLIEESDGDLAVVVMGHTHLARHIGPADKATYINTGTWADVVRVPHRALEDGADADLEDFLRQLREDKRPEVTPAYADLRIEPDGQVTHARLRRPEAPTA